MDTEKQRRLQFNGLSQPEFADVFLEDSIIPVDVDSFDLSPWLDTVLATQEFAVEIKLSLFFTTI